MLRMELMVAVVLVEGLVLNTMAVYITEETSTAPHNGKYYYKNRTNYPDYYRKPTDGVNATRDDFDISEYGKYYHGAIKTTESQYYGRSPFLFFFPMFINVIESMKEKNGTDMNWGRSLLLTALCNYYSSVGIESSSCT